MSRERLETEIVRLLGALRVAREPRAAALRRELAEATMALRATFLTPTGDADWAGTSGHYRRTMRDLYARAGYSPAERRITQSTARYHIGNILRERLPAAELEAAGLTAPSPQARQRTRRARNAAIVAASTAAAEAAPGASQVLADLAEALRLLRRVQRPTGGTVADARAAAQTLDAIESELARVRRGVDRDAHVAAVSRLPRLRPDQMTVMTADDGHTAK